MDDYINKNRLIGINAKKPTGCTGRKSEAGRGLSPPDTQAKPCHFYNAAGLSRRITAAFMRLKRARR
jgi:hypothetical protein